MKKLTILIIMLMLGCDKSQPTSVSGVKRAEVKIEVGSDGLTVEQRNIKNRLKLDNNVGSIKHLYIISAYSGKAIVYSTVKGKVTSSSKRLTPTSVASGLTRTSDLSSTSYGIPITIGGKKYRTSEVIQDDGSYGSSIPYLYWWDSNGRYHQHYVSGGQIIHISDQPIRTNEVIINMEVIDEK